MKKLISLDHPGILILKLLGSIIAIELLILLTLYFTQDSPAFRDALSKSGIKKGVESRGAAWGDYDRDGFLDLLITGKKTALYHNDGGKKFTDVTQKAGVLPRSSTSGIFGDYDNDGCSDIFFVGYDNESNSLYHNNCSNTFTDVTQKANIKKSAYRGFGAAWADYNNDGYLDLYVANYGIPTFKPRGLIIQPNILYENNRDGTFSDVTAKMGVDGITNCAEFVQSFTRTFPQGWPFQESFQPIWFDYNNDGKIDLLVATDAGINPLYKNSGNTFTEVTRESGLCRGGTGMGVTVGDYDNDGYLDLYVTNVGANFLWHNNGNGTFSEVGAEKGVVDPLTIGWGTEFIDYDNDGNLDLYSISGSVSSRHGIYDPEIGTIMLDKLYKNSGDGKFIDVAKEEGLYGDYPKAAAAFGDYNNDGFVDIFVVTGYFKKDSVYQLYKNQGSKNNWLTIQLVGMKSNRDSVGARITLKAEEKTQIREVISGSSFISQSSLRQTFGLGTSPIVDNIEIKWPSGIKKTLKNIKANQKIVVLEENN